MLNPTCAWRIINEMIQTNQFLKNEYANNRITACTWRDKTDTHTEQALS